MHKLPQNGGYMVAAYIVTAVVLVGYWVRLMVKAKSQGLRAESGERRA